MPSNINTTDIDIEFPVAGQDNDSQGFRDNFNTINTNFSSAKTEIEDLQTNVVRKDTDTTFLDNADSNPVTLIDANVKGLSHTYFTPENGVVVSDTTVNVSNGGYQVYILGGGTINLGFDNWPVAGYYGKVRLHITATVQTTLGFSGTNIKTDSLGSTFWGSPVIGIDEVHVIDFWSYQAGNTVYAQYLGAYT